MAVWTEARRRPILAAFMLLALVFVVFRSVGHYNKVVKRREARELRKSWHEEQPTITVPDPLPECPQLIPGYNVSKTRTGPKVLMSSGAYNNVVDGVSKTLNRLVADLQARNFQVVIIAPVGEKPAMPHYGLLYPAPSVTVPFRPEYRLALGLDRCTREFFEAYDPDIVHVASPDYLGQQVQMWANEQGLPVVCSYHTRFNSYLPYYLGSFVAPVDSAVWAWMRYFYNRCHHTYPPTPSVSQELRRHGVTSELRIWPRGIDLTLFNPNRRSEALRTAWGADSNTVVLLTVCRLVWEKNLREIIETIKLLSNQGEHFLAVVVGEGPARARMQEELPNVVFSGFLGGVNLSTAFASADLFFFPSLTETWGAVTLEAMASGLPVIVADAPGSKELVTNDHTGFLITPGRPQRWANAVVRLLHSPDLRARLAANALQKVSQTQSYTWERATNMVLSHYSDLLSTTKRYQDLFEVPGAYDGNSMANDTSLVGGDDYAAADALLDAAGHASEEGRSVVESPEADETQGV
ncbi:uncharacterized protein MONBRDRAFT_11530 [Monosiga brevicollis MX1]|uniref:Glycosyltransferase subfamily 4-like N-terminal domain-containing protein n=1 Tax=Monosiga brevicollis TaxID=81824 RepID=A9V9F0_MONBE|nr:uncharacterized protein MONBRDRAFT_11530 [Monosiga brevicollis MX1]EDQ85919.1 predicted protein [Monosiga brevicollis MX1]|eukprot:XP_001749398.1 hypothetical protein [Monosiga brevicollis MX1]